MAKVQLVAWAAYGGLLTAFAIRAVRDGQPGSAIFIAALVPVFTHALLQVPAIRRRRRRVRQCVGVCSPHG
jgi:hypothetical protein